MRVHIHLLPVPLLLLASCILAFVLGCTAPPATASSAEIPEQPTPESMASALGAVMGSVKACVKGADDNSRAVLAFSPNGTVNDVTVTGWATTHGQSECITAALRNATVPPFTKPTYTTGVTIRP